MKTDVKTPLLFISDVHNKTLVLPVPTNINDGNYARIRRDVERILWFSKGYGGVEDKQAETLTFSFEPEEYACVLRYLIKFEWKQTDSLCFTKQECPLNK